MHAKAFCPSHITGFFEICDNDSDPLKRGSRGAGISITKGVTTEVAMEEANQTEIKVFINGEIDSAPVTRYVASHMPELKKSINNFHITVRHDIQVPVGCGMGSSGAGAWGTALALNQLLRLSLSHDNVGQLAHNAEVENKTGLGTVLGQQKGGIEIRTSPGAPGIGHVEQISFDPDLRVICSTLGPISTKSMLSNPKVRARVNQFGGQFVKQLAKNPSPAELMRLSRKFVEQTQLLSKELQEGLETLDEHGFHNSSMALFGETIFSLVRLSETDDVVSLLKEWNKKGETFSSEIDTKGARLLECERDD